MMSEINLLKNFYQTMIWFGKSIIKFCKSFINLQSSLVHGHAALPGLEITDFKLSIKLSAI